MNIRKIGKKGAVGETLTWAMAFGIIFFIMFVFFFSSMFISSDAKGFEIKQEDDRLETIKNDFYKNVQFDPTEIKFVKEIKND
jgi:hypothetical protein